MSVSPAPVPREDMRDARRSPCAPLRRAVLLTGFSSQFSQILVFREAMAQTHATELLFGAALAAWLGWSALGAVSGRGLAALLPKRETRVAALALGVALFGPALAAQILLMRHGPWAAGAGEILAPDQALLLVALGAAPTAWLGGTVFSLALGVGRKEHFGLLYRAEAWGALAGGLVTALVLLWWGPPLWLALFVGAVLACGSIAALRPWLGTARTALLVPVALFAGLLALLPLDRISEEITWATALPGAELVETRETRQMRLSLLQRGQSLLVFGNSAPLAAVEPGASQARWSQLAALLLCQHESPRRLLVAGATLTPLAEKLLAYPAATIESLEVVELDPEITALARELGMVPRDDRLQVVDADLRGHVRDVPENSLDLIVLFAPEPDSSVVSRLLSVEFFSLVRQALDSNGVVCVVLPSHGSSAEYTGQAMALRTGSVLAALEEVFPQVQTAPVAGHMLVAWDGSGEGGPNFSPAILAQRLAGLGGPGAWIEVDTGQGREQQHLDPSQYSLYFSTMFGGVLAEQVAFLTDETDQPVVAAFSDALGRANAPPNRDAQPVAVLHGVRVWQDLGRDPGQAQDSPYFLLAQSLSGLGLRHLAYSGLVLAAGVAILAAFSRRRQYKRGASPMPGPGLALFCALATGAFSLAMYAVLLTAYQSLVGNVYAELGVLSALFMAGLGLGAYLAEHPKSPAASRPKAGLLVLLSLMIGLCVLTPPAISWAGTHLDGTGARLLIGLLVVLTGLANGASFPLLPRIAPRWRASSPGAWLYTADLAGAALAGLVVSPLLIPVLGMTATLGIFAVVLGVAGVGVGATLPRNRSTRESIRYSFT